MYEDRNQETFKSPDPKIFSLKNSIFTPQMTPKILPLNYFLKKEALKNNSKIVSALSIILPPSTALSRFSRRFSLPQEC